MNQNNKTYIIGNWKMNKNYNDIFQFKRHWKQINRKDPIKKNQNLLIGICPSTVCLVPTISLLRKQFEIIAQDCWYEKYGAFTNCNSYAQLQDFNVKYSLLGHSETRQYLNETNERINLKAKLMLTNKMIPIVCIGETLKEYNAKKTATVLKEQILKCFKGFEENLFQNIIIAYEPIWAIGSGKTPTIQIVSDVVKLIRNVIAKQWSKQASEQLAILYGGSVNDANAKNFLEIKGLNGLLIGNASLNANTFHKIVKCVK